VIDYLFLPSFVLERLVFVDIYQNHYYCVIVFVIFTFIFIWYFNIVGNLLRYYY